MQKLVLANYYLNSYTRYSETSNLKDEIISSIKNQTLVTDPFFNELVYVLEIASDHDPAIEIPLERKNQIDEKLNKLKIFFKSGWNRNFNSSMVFLRTLGSYQLDYLQEIKNQADSDISKEIIRSIVGTALGLVGARLDLNSGQTFYIENDIILNADEVFHNEIFNLLVESCELLVRLIDDEEIIDSNLNVYFNRHNENVQNRAMVQESLRQLFIEHEENYRESFCKKIILNDLENTTISSVYERIQLINLHSLYESSDREFCYYNENNLPLQNIINDAFLIEAIFDYDFLNAVLLYLKNHSQNENVNSLEISDLVNIISRQIFTLPNYLNRYKLFPLYFQNGDFPLFYLNDNNLLLINILNDFIDYGQSSNGETIIHEPRFKLPTQFFSKGELMLQILARNSQYLFQIDLPEYRSKMSYIMKAMICQTTFLLKENIDPRCVVPVLGFGDFLGNNIDTADVAPLNDDVDDWF
jgi:hypothetical protein